MSEALKFTLKTFKKSGKYYQDIKLDVPNHFKAMYEVTDYIRLMINAGQLSPNYYYLVDSDTVDFAYPCLITLDSIHNPSTPYIKI
jgi:hypothetical protein